MTKFEKTRFSQLKSQQGLLSDRMAQMARYSKPTTDDQLKYDHLFGQFERVTYEIGKLLGD